MCDSGLGIYEYLVWIELMGMQSIMAVWDGYSLDGTSVAEDDLAPYIEQARAQVSLTRTQARQLLLITVCHYARRLSSWWGTHRLLAVH